jgi:hypothetical protein
MLLRRQEALRPNRPLPCDVTYHLVWALKVRPRLRNYMKLPIPSPSSRATMARRDSVTARKTRRQSLKLPHQGHLSASSFSTGLTSKGKRPQGIKKGQKQNPLRRSARLDRLIEVSETQPKASHQPLPSPVSDIKSPHVSRQRHAVMED